MKIEGGRDRVKPAVSQLWNSSFFAVVVSPSDKQNMGKYSIRFPCSRCLIFLFVLLCVLCVFLLSLACLYFVLGNFAWKFAWSILLACKMLNTHTLKQYTIDIFF